MALSIKLSNYVSGGFTNPVRWDLYETGTGVLVDSHAEAGPHGQVYNFSFVNNIRDIVYTVKFYDVPSGATVGNLIKSHDVTVTTSTVVIYNDLELVVGGAEDEDPVAGSSSITIDQLINKKIRFEQRAIGTLFQTREPEYTFDPLTGTIELLNGQTFNDQDKYVVIILPEYTINPAGTQQASSIYKSIEIITAGQTLTTLDMGKLLIVDGVASVITLKFAAISALIEKVPIWVESVGTTHTNVILEAANTEVMTGLGSTSYQFILGKGEKAQVIKLGSALYFFTDSTDIKKVGQFEWGDYVGLNRLVGDGTEYNQADLPRLVQSLNENYAAGQVVTSLATWNATQVIAGKTVAINKGFFALYSVSGVPKVRVPDYRNLSVRALKNIGGVDTSRITNKPGGYQHEEVGPHIDKFDIYENGTGNSISVPAKPAITDNSTIYKGEGQTKMDLTKEQIVSNHGKIPLVII